MALVFVLTLFRDIRLFLFQGAGVILTAGGFLPGRVCSKAGANPAKLADHRKSLISQRYMSVIEG
jgi:hypothetical protein